MNSRIVDLEIKTDGRGKLIPLEYPKQLSFPLQRIYYIYDVNNGIVRGRHSHRDLEQILIAVSGSLKVRIKTPFSEEIVTLNDPSKGLYVGPMIWREMLDFSDDAVLLVLASHEYDESDYIRDYEQYKNEADSYFESHKEQK